MKLIIETYRDTNCIKKQCETYKEFVSHLLEERVFEDYEDIRIAALIEYDVVLPAKA